MFRSTTSRQTERKADRAPGFTLIELLIVIAIIAILALIAIPNFLEAQTRAKVSRVQSDMRSVATALEAYFVDNNAYIVNPYSKQTRSQAYKFYMTSVGPDTTAYGTPSGCMLTTPIAYLTSLPMDPFVVRGVSSGTTPSPMDFSDASYFFINFLTPSQRDDITGYNSGAGGVTVEAPTMLCLCNPTADPGLRKIPVYWMLVSPGPKRSTTLVDPHGTGTSYSYTSVMNRQYYYDAVSDGTMFCNYDPTNGTTSMGGILRANSPIE